jgi:RNA polymerase sigma-70 factor (ECF subfamily)
MDDPKSLSDDDLVRWCVAGDGFAFTEITRRYADHLLGVVRRLVRDRHLALDLTQEIFLKLYRALPQYRPQGNFRSFLFALALNRARDAVRAQRRHKIFFIDDYRQVVRRRSSSAHQIDRVAERKAIEDALAQVSAPFQEAVYLRDVVGLSYEELAQAMNCTLGTAKSRVNRGRFAFAESYQRLTGAVEQATRGRG